MKLHERYFPVNEAAIEFRGWVIDWVQRHDLTCGELMRILAQEIDSWARYQVRLERHGEDSDKKGDEA